MTAESSSGELLLYKREDGSPSIEVRLEDETVWLSQQQTADLFQTTKRNVSLHVRNAFAEGELERTNCQGTLDGWQRLPLVRRSPLRGCPWRPRQLREELVALRASARTAREHAFAFQVPEPCEKKKGQTE